MTPAAASMLRLHFTKPHVKYHFGCDVTRFTKNTRKSESRSQIHQIVFEVPDHDVENVKSVLFVVSVMLPISNQYLKTVSGTSLVLNCSLSAEIDQHKPQKGCRNTCSSSCRFKMGNSKVLLC